MTGKPRGKSGRWTKEDLPSRSWEELFQEWCGSGMKRTDFLRSKGINPNTGGAHRATGGWALRLEKIAARSALTDAKEHEDEPQPVPVEVEARKAEVLTALGRNPDGVKEAALPNPWQAIKAWRAKQATEDYKTADTLRMHVKLLLKNSLKRVKVKREDGTEVEEFQSTLRPHELRALGQVSSDIQRIQRLALGLSTENVGVDPGGGSHIEGGGREDALPMKQVGPVPPADKKDEDAEVPVFVVEMSHRGKFMRARPRKVQ